MANTLIPIQTYTLTSTAASVTFSNIPQNYTDLKVVISARTGRADNGDYILPSLNGAEGNSGRILWGYGTTITVDSVVNNVLIVPGDSATAGTFSNSEFYIPKYTSNQSKSIITDSSAEDNATASQGISIGTIRWTSGSASTSAVTSITLTGRFSSLLSGSTFTLYGISNGVKASGGTVTIGGGYAYHTFTSTGSFIPTQLIKNAECMIVAGGAGGGGGFNVSPAMGGGGGGAGGVTNLTGLTLNAGTTYTALVGAGGSAGGYSNLGGAIAGSSGGSGSNSIFSVLTASGGGGGGGRFTAPVSGGSGGGSASDEGSAAGTGVSGQGNAGGLAYGSGTSRAGGGGGGAGAVGSRPNGNQGGAGGDGNASYSLWHAITGTGSSGCVGGGGGGGGGSSGIGGYGGAGGGGIGGYLAQAGSDGLPNTGGGGGGGQGAASASGTSGNGGAGGSGLIIVRYPLS